jgi:hypothetical protein
MGASMTDDMLTTTTPNNWLNWGKVMPVNSKKALFTSEKATTTKTTDETESSSEDDSAADVGFYSAYNVAAWTNWLGSVPSEKKAVKGSKVKSLFEKNMTENEKAPCA